MSLQARTQGGGGGGGGFIDPQSVSPVTDAVAPGSEKPNTSANEKPKPGSGGELDNPWLIGPIVGMGMCYINSMIQNAMCTRLCGEEGVSSFDSGICGHRAECVCNRPLPPPFPPVNPLWPPGLMGWQTRAFPMSMGPFVVTRP